MLIGGLQKLTLIDFPGKVAATVFTVGCNFRCPFCHNPELVVASRFHEADRISEKYFFDFLESRKGKLDGVCITGGEPTIQPDIIDFIRRIKEAGFAVKLDSNGTNPEILEKVFAEGLIDFIAMDIKHQLEKYYDACLSDLFGDFPKIDLKKISRSVELIRASGVPYEFRTTVVPGIHTVEDFEIIARWLDGAERYALQQFREGKLIDERLAQNSQAPLDLEEVKKNIENHFGEVIVRG